MENSCEVSSCNLPIQCMVRSPASKLLRLKLRDGFLAAYLIFYQIEWFLPTFMPSFYISLLIYVALFLHSMYNAYRWHSNVLLFCSASLSILLRNQHIIYMFESSSVLPPTLYVDSAWLLYICFVSIRHCFLLIFLVHYSRSLNGTECLSTFDADGQNHESLQC